MLQEPEPEEPEEEEAEHEEYAEDWQDEETLPALCQQNFTIWLILES